MKPHIDSIWAFVAAHPTAAVVLGLVVGWGIAEAFLRIHRWRSKS